MKLSELLWVMALLALLAAILMPCYCRAIYNTEVCRQRYVYGRFSIYEAYMQEEAE